MLTDQEIMRRCRLGQTDLLNLLTNRYGTDLFTFCCRLCRNHSDAEDLFQDVWMAVLRHCRHYDGQKAFAPWLYTICLNRQRNLFRRTGRWIKGLARLTRDKNTSSAEEGSCIAGPYADCLEKEKKQRLELAMEQLSEQHRLPLILLYFGEMSVADVAVILGVSEGTVKSRLSRARERLRQLLQEVRHG